MRLFKNKKRIGGFIHQNFSRKISGGFMAIEVVIASSIILVSILAAMLVAQKSIQVSHRTLHLAEASFLLEEGAEIVRINRDNGWSNISSLTPGINYYPIFSNNTWTLSNVPNMIDIFTRKINVVSVKRDNTTKDISISGADDSGTKLITITVSWVEAGQTINKTLSFYLTDIFS